MEIIRQQGEVLFYREGAYQLFQNIGNGNHWLKIDLVGDISNRDGIGAQIHLLAGDVTQMRQQSNGTHWRAQNDKRIHFGLGPHNIAQQLKIFWPSQTRQVLSDIES